MLGLFPMFRTVVLALILALSLQVSPAGARTIAVVPGPGTPLQDAIDAAAPGDTLRILEGTFSEAIVIPKPLRLMGRNATIDAGCVPMTAVTIAANAVTLRGLVIKGGNFYGVDATNRDLIIIDRLTVVPTCDGVEYGINVCQGTNMRIRNHHIEDPVGFEDAAIYIGGTPPDADLRVERNVLTGPNDRGIIVEDSLDDLGRPIAVRVRKNVITGAGTGIFVFGSAGAEILNNVINGGSGPGIDLTVNSSDNQIVGNRLSGNAPDVVDDGTNNCWRNNHFTSGSVPPC